MPKRLIDDSLLDSRSLEVLSPGAQDAFPRFILLADDFGCFEVNVTKLRANGWSRRPDVTEAMVEGWLTEYAERQASDPATGERLAPVLMLWTHVGRRYGFLTGWFGAHGQKRRAEYDPQAPAGTPGRHGSKRKTPRPPAELLAAVMAGDVRVIDGKPPGTDRDPDGNTEEEIPSDSTPARETAGSEPGTGRDDTGNRSVPAPAVPVAVPVAGAGGKRRVRPALTEEEWPLTAALLAAMWAAGFEVEWPRDRVSAGQVEKTIELATLPVALSRLQAKFNADKAARIVTRPWLGWHLDTIAGGKAGKPPEPEPPKRRAVVGVDALGQPVFAEAT